MATVFGGGGFTEVQGIQKVEEKAFAVPFRNGKRKEGR